MPTTISWCAIEAATEGVAGHASCDLRRGRDRRCHRLLPEPEAGRGRGRRAHRRRLRRVGEIGRVPRARLVRRLAARVARPQELRASCRARQRVRWQVGLSAAGGARRRGQRPAPAGLGRPTARGARLGHARGDRPSAAGYDGDDGAGPSGRVHEGHDGGSDRARRPPADRRRFPPWSSTPVAGAFAASWSRAS